MEFVSDIDLVTLAGERRSRIERLILGEGPEARPAMKITKNGMTGSSTHSCISDRRAKVKTTEQNPIYFKFPSPLANHLPR